ncbi:MAG: thrombospondin type 3 repeat-containing protein [Candidatus Paceibacterota bacterium]|jgi:hypothetical protein
MENKNKNSANANPVPGAFVVPKLDPKNEIVSGPEEKLISESNKDGISMNAVAGGSIGSRINQRNNVPRQEGVSGKAIPVTEKSKTEFKENETPYGSFDRTAAYGKSDLKKKNKLPIILIIAVLFMVSAIAAAVFFFKPENVLVKREGPQDIIQSSINAMRGLKTYTSNGNVNLVYDTVTEQTGSYKYDLNVGLSGKTDASDIENAKSEANMKIKLEMTGEAGGEDYSLELEGRSFGAKEAYYRINALDLGIMGMILGPQVNTYKGKWYLLDMEELKKMPGYNEEEGLAYENYNIGKLMDIVNKYEIFKFKEDLGDQKINDADVYHYKTGLDGMAVMYMYMDMLKEMASNYKGANLEEMQSSLEKMKKDVEGNYKDLINEGFQNIESEIWIGKTDRLIYRITMKGNFNEQYIKKFTDATFGSARAKAEDAKTKSEVAQVRTGLEIYFDDNNSSYENYKLPVYSDLKPENVRSSQDAYVIWSDLSGVEDKWCSDSTGRSGYSLEEIAGYECPEFLTNSPIGADKKPEPGTEEPGDSDVKMNVGFNADISYSEFNQPVNIEKPEGAANFFKELNGGSFFGEGGSAGLDSDKDGLDNYMESYYKTDPNDPDTDRDGYSDGDEVQNGYDPAKPGSAKL